MDGHATLARRVGDGFQKYRLQSLFHGRYQIRTPDGMSESYKPTLLLLIVHKHSVIVREERQYILVPENTFSLIPILQYRAD
jgi:hypothetical protein